MWSHYAGSHSGLLVHFDATMAPIGNARRVEYQDPYPQLPIPPVGLEPAEIVRRCLLTKSTIWKYESEFRFIDFPFKTERGERVLDGILQRRSDQMVILPPSAIIGITIGVRMPDQFQRHVIELARNRGAPTAVWRADLEHARFAMRFDRL